MAAAANTAAIQQQGALLAQALQDIQNLQQQLAAAAPAAAVAPGGAPAAAVAVDHSAAMLAMARRQAAGPPPQFKGSSSGLDAQRFIGSMNRWFLDAGVVADAERLSIMGSRGLTHPATTWWESELRRPANDPQRITTWAAFSVALLKRFEPVDKAVWGRQQLLALTNKGVSSVTSYNDQFNEIVATLADMAEADRVFYYQQGLPSHIRNVLSTKVLATLQEAIEFAVRAEAARSSAPAPASSSGQRWQQRQRPAGLNNMEQEDIEASGEAGDSTVSALFNMVKQMGEQLAAMKQSSSGGSSGRGRQQQQSNSKLGWTEGLSPELARARMNKHLCIHCGQSGHMKRDCRNTPDLTTQPK